MADDNTIGNGGKGFTSSSTLETGSRNKRKHISEISMQTLTEESSSLTEFPRYELQDEKFPKSHDQAEEENVEDPQTVNWDDPSALQLQDFLSHNLSATFRIAIKKVAECGYNEKVAECAVLRTGVYYGSKDVVSNIVDGALVYLMREKEIDSSAHHLFEDLKDLVDYIILEMINLLREIKPSLSVVDAMWCLLIDDLNLSHICGAEGDISSGKEIIGESLSDSTHAQSTSETKSLDTIVSNPNKPHISKASNHDSQNSQPERPHLSNQKTPIVHEVPLDKSGGCRKMGCSGHSKRDMLQQRAFHFEKNYKGRMSKGAFKAKLTSWGGLVLDKKLKTPSNPSGVNVKNSNTVSKVGNSIGAKAPHPDGALNLSANNPSVLPIKDTVLCQEAKTSPKALVSISTSDSFKGPDYYYAGIPYDESLGKYVPQDEKDEIVLALVPNLQALLKELQGWTDWANEKVMQAARRLSKDQPELKALRQEKEEAEKFKREKQILEDNTMKRLSEMENALANATAQMETANSNFGRLEAENSVLKKDLEAARLEALRSASNLQEAGVREKEALKKAQSWDPLKGLLQEEITTCKFKVAELKQEVEKAKGVHNQIEARRKQEDAGKVELLTELGSVTMERGRLEAVAKAQEDNIKQKADNAMQKIIDDIKKLEDEISELRLESESLKIEALRRGINVNYGSFLKDSKSSSNSLAVFRDNFGAGSVKPEQECVMCLTEEISVIFLPCAHQVLCGDCNVLHEKQGMSDCPSCRTPIQKRINVRFANS